MHIDRLVRTDRPGGPRISARITWEGAHRGPDELWFETDESFGEALEPAPEAFLVAALPLAVGLGEPRLGIEARVCPRVRDGLVRAMGMLAGWYPWCHEVPIEASGGFAPLVPRTPPRVAGFLSGGVDSLSMLRAVGPARGPDGRAPFDLIHLFGWHWDDFDGQSPRAERLRAYGAQHARLSRFAAAIGHIAIPVRTNVRTFHPSFAWSIDVGFGAGMIATAHAFKSRFTEALFASGGFPADHPPHGSHPHLDGLYSSTAVEVRHAEPDRTRLEKVRAIAEWPEAMSVLEVCLHHEVPAADVVNCGRCEKCVRTMLAFAAIDRLDAAVTFPDREHLADRLRDLRWTGSVASRFAIETAGALDTAGRHELAELLRRKVSESERRERRRHRWWRRLARAVRGRGAKR